MEYLLWGVLPGEFEELKKHEQEITADVMQSFNEVWKPRVQHIKTTFKYNPQRYVIGIYVEKQERLRLILDSKEVTREEDAVVGSLYLTLERRLDKMRLLKEKFVDSVSS